MKSIKRWCSMLLIWCLVLSMLPGTVLAANTIQNKAHVITPDMNTLALGINHNAAITEDPGHL